MEDPENGHGPSLTDDRWLREGHHGNEGSARRTTPLAAPTEGVAIWPDAAVALLHPVASSVGRRGKADEGVAAAPGCAAPTDGIAVGPVAAVVLLQPVAFSVRRCGNGAER